MKAFPIGALASVALLSLAACNTMKGESASAGAKGSPASSTSEQKGDTGSSTGSTSDTTTSEQKPQ